MGRKSRKPSALADTAASAQAQWWMAAYVRLSVKDSGTNKEDTIENQKVAVLEYLGKHPEMELFDIYCDNGQTGTVFERPAFDRMIEDIRQGKVNGIVVKDLSRFGRNYLEAGNYIEQVFPSLGVRFISICEDFDTLTAERAEEGYIIPLRNIINDIYAKDISLKSGSALQTKQRNGDFIGAWASYGYMRSPADKHRLIVDDETAPVVRQIFAWRAQGLGYNAIIRALCARNIPSPGAYRFSKGLMKKESMAHVPWRMNTLKVILQSEVYLGHTVQGRKRAALYLSELQKKLPREEWTVVRDTHEALVDQDTFDRVQALSQVRSEEHNKKLGDVSGETETSENVLKGLVVCGCCGTRLSRRKNRNHNKNDIYVYYSYLCPRHNAGCAFTSIAEPKLLSAIFTTLKTQTAIASELEVLLKRLQGNPQFQHRVSSIQMRIKALNKEIAEKEQYQRKSFESLANNLIDEAQFRFMQQLYGEETAELKTSLSALEQEAEFAVVALTPENEWIQMIKGFADCEAVTYELAHTLINEIVVENDGRVNISLRYMDECQKLVKFLLENKEVA